MKLYHINSGIIVKVISVNSENGEMVLRTIEKPENAPAYLKIGKKNITSVRLLDNFIIISE